MRQFSTKIYISYDIVRDTEMGSAEGYNPP